MAIIQVLGEAVTPDSQVLISSLLSLSFLILVTRIFRCSGGPLMSKAPTFVLERWPLLGAWSFWTRRWSFFEEAIEASAHGNFSFFAGNHMVVGLSGDTSRKTFFESKQLGLAEGYAILLGKVPKSKVVNEKGENVYDKQEFLVYMKERLKRMVRKEALEYHLPTLISDTRNRLDEFAASPGGITNPFDGIYKLIYILMMRTIGCVEIARDRRLLDQTLVWYHRIAESAKPLAILFPSLPSISVVKRFYYGARLYLTFNGIVTKRKANFATAPREEDPLDDMVNRQVENDHIIGVLLGAIFSGQQNTSVSAAWLMVHIAHNKEWQEIIREEIKSVARKYDPNEDVALLDRLSEFPLEAWEEEFPMIELCIKENGRLHGLGAMFRQNTGADLPLNGGSESIPHKAFAAYHTGEVHLNPAVYRDPMVWDPSRYLPDRAEDKKRPLAWLGWGAGRHPCLGMRFAKLELHLIVALSLARFNEIKLCDREGHEVTELPPMNLETYLSDKPKLPVYLRTM